MYPCFFSCRFYRLCVSGIPCNPDTNPHANVDARSHSNACTHSFPHADVCPGAHVGRADCCHGYIHACD